MKKNDLLEIKIEAMGNAGEGIGKIDGYPLFVKDALPGDTARVRLTKNTRSSVTPAWKSFSRPRRTGRSPAVLCTGAAAAVRFRHFPMKSSWNTRKIRCARSDPDRRLFGPARPACPRHGGALSLPEPRPSSLSEEIGRGASSPAFMQAAPTRLCRARTAPSACRKIKRSWRRFWTS